MPENKTLTGTLEMRYTPDEYTQEEKEAGASWPLGGGYWDLGFVVDGAFFAIRRIHGGEAEKLFRLARENGYTPPEEQQPQQADTSALEARLAALEAAQQQPPEPPQEPPAEQA